METTLKNNKLQIFIFRSRNQQFVSWGQEEAKWCEKYKDYFTIIDDGEGQIEHNPFKVMKISDFKNPLYLDNKSLHEGVGLLNIANNLDQFDYQYIGFLHMDFMPLYFNSKYFETNFECGYPIQPSGLFNFDEVLNQIKEEKQYLFSLSLLKAMLAFSWHIQDFNVIINQYNITIWDWLSNRFGIFNILNLTEQQIQNLKLSIACSFIAKKTYWNKLKLFIDNIDELSNLQKYGNKINEECKCDKKVIVSQLLQAFVELTILDYITQNNNINFNLIPVCHFN